MNNEQTNKTDTAGTQDNTSSEETKTPSEFEKLKTSNDEMEKELVRGRELKAESQKLEAEKMLSGTAGGHVEAEVKERTPKEYAESIMKGKVPDGE